MKKKQLDSLSTCPVCGRALVSPCGPPDARAVIVSDRPGERELELLRPFVGPAGSILHRELLRVGLRLDDFRLANVWMHEPTKECLDWHFDQCAREATKFGIQLILGSVACKMFFDKPLSALSGIVIRHKNLLAVCGPNPADLFHEPVGEFRLTLTRFAAAYRRLR